MSWMRHATAVWLLEALLRAMMNLELKMYWLWGKHLCESWSWNWILRFRFRGGHRRGWLRQQLWGCCWHDLIAFVEVFHSAHCWFLRCLKTTHWFFMQSFRLTFSESAYLWNWIYDGLKSAWEYEAIAEPLVRSDSSGEPETDLSGFKFEMAAVNSDDEVRKGVSEGLLSLLCLGVGLTYCASEFSPRVGISRRCFVLKLTKRFLDHPEKKIFQLKIWTCGISLKILKVIFRNSMAKSIFFEAAQEVIRNFGIVRKSYR